MFQSPVRSINLYVTRLDVTFDAFRVRVHTPPKLRSSFLTHSTFYEPQVRDAELLRQAALLACEKAMTSKIHWNAVFFDALAQALAPPQCCQDD